MNIDCRCDFTHSVRCWQEIAGIQIAHVVAIERAQALVHGIVDAFVGLGGYLYLMTVLGGVRSGDVIVDKLQCIVGRCTIDNEMHDVRVVLLEHAVECALQHLGGIECDGNVGDAYHRR